MIKPRPEIVIPAFAGMTKSFSCLERELEQSGLRFLKLLAIGALLAGLAGCASVRSSNEEVKDIASDEGIVVASILVLTDEAHVSGEEDNKFTGKGGLFGPNRTKNTSCNFTIHHIVENASLVSTLAGKYTYASDSFKINQEYYFVKKLPAGNYFIADINLGNNFFLPFRHNFSVTSGQAAYVGKFIITLPKYFVKGDKIGVQQLNDIQNARNYITQNFPDLEFPLQLRPGTRGQSSRRQ